MGGDQGMVTTEQEALGRATVAQRWLARLALVAAAAAVLVPLAAIGFRASVALVLVGMAGMGLTAAGIWWALTNKGLVRWLAIAVAVWRRWWCWSCTRAGGCCGSCWWRSGCWGWRSPSAGRRWAATRPPRRCPSMTPRRPGGPI